MASLVGRDRRPIALREVGGPEDQLADAGGHVAFEVRALGILPAREHQDGVALEELGDVEVEQLVAFDLRRLAMQEGMLTLRQSGLIKVREGATTIDEIVRETM